MTGKQALNELQKERYDIKGLEIVFHAPDGAIYSIGDIEIDEVNHRIVLTSDGIRQGTGEAEDFVE